MARLLLCIDESPASLAATRALRAAGHEPWLALSHRDTPASRSRLAAGVARVVDPQLDPAGYANEVASLSHGLGASAVLPATESALRALSGRESLFEAAVGTNGVELLDRVTDKALLAVAGAEAGLPAPPALELRAGDDLGPVTYPAVVKPLRTVDATGDGTLRTADVIRVDDEPELERALVAAGGPMLVQRYVTGTLAAVAGVAWRGETVVTGHQRSERIWPPGRGITAFGRTVPIDPELDVRVRELVAWSGWSGVFQVQVIDDGERRWLIDLNPRLYGSLGLLVAAGLNLPAIWVELLLGREPAPAAARIGQRYRVEENDVRALAALFRAGRRREALGGLLPRPRTAHATFAWRDPAPAGYVVSKALGRARQRVTRSRSSRSTS